MLSFRGRLLEVGFGVATVVTFTPFVVVGEEADSALQVLQRMDLNRDGKLAPSEIPKGAESFVAGLVGEGGLDSAKPISLERLATARRSLTRNSLERELKSKVIVKSSSDGSQASADPAAQYAENLLRLYDKDHSGALEPDEWKQLNSSWGKWDADGDRALQVTELSAAFATMHREEAEKARLRPLDRSPVKASYQVSQRGGNERRSYRFLTPAERLPSGIPAWFLASDADGDGQVAMAEFTSEWTDAKVAEFSIYDTNNDGIITPKECLAAEKSPR